MPLFPDTMIESVNASSEITGVDSVGELLLAPSVPARDSVWPLPMHESNEGIAVTSSESNLRSRSRKKAQKYDVSTVPAYSSPKASNLVPLALFNDQFNRLPSQQQRIGHTANININKCTQQPLRHDVPCTATKDARRCTCSGREGTYVLQEKNPLHMDKRQAEQFDSHGHNTQHRSQKRKRKRKGLRSRATGRDVRLAVEGSQRECVSEQIENGLKTRRVLECYHRSEPPVTNMEVQSTSNQEKRLRSTEEDENDLIPSPCKALEPDQSESCPSANEQFIDSMENSGSLVEKERLILRKLIKVIGKSEYWKARQGILRQQKIFTDQVFELHRLVQVQQILLANLAISPVPLAVEGKSKRGDFEKLPEEIVEAEQADELHCTVPASPGLFDVYEPLNFEPHDTVDTELRENSKGPAHLEGPFISHECTADSHLDSSYHPATLRRVHSEPAMDYPCSVAPLVPVEAPGAPTAPWDCPSFPIIAGVTKRFGDVPTPSGSYTYSRPSATTFGTLLAYSKTSSNRPCVPAMCVPGKMEMVSITPYGRPPLEQRTMGMPPVAPFGIHSVEQRPMETPAVTPLGMPSFEQGPGLLQNMQGYNSFQPQQRQNAVFCLPVPSNPSAGWYGEAPMPFVDPVAFTSSYRGYDEITRVHQASPYPRAAQRIGTHFSPGSHSSPFVMPQLWNEMSNGQPAGCEPNLFQSLPPRYTQADLVSPQAPRSTQAYLFQAEAPRSKRTELPQAPAPSMTGANLLRAQAPRSTQVDLFRGEISKQKFSEISASRSLRSLEIPACQSIGVPPSRQGENGVVYHWQCPDATGSQDVDRGADEILYQMQESAKGSEGKTSTGRQGFQPKVTVPCETSRNGPSQTENFSPKGQSSMPAIAFSGILKVVPQQTVSMSTVESAAEILMLLQKNGKP